jgi:hypothetical protein
MRNAIIHGEHAIKIRVDNCIRERKSKIDIKKIEEDNDDVY